VNDLYVYLCFVTRTLLYPSGLPGFTPNLNGVRVALYLILCIVFFPHSRLITEFVTRLTQRVPLVDLELLTLPEHLSSSPVLVGFVVLDL
jgi:hypothetical protein